MEEEKKEFASLKERMEYYKTLWDYQLPKKSYVLVHIDGRSFSKMVKKKYELPFDDRFIDMMNKTAAYICENVQGAKMAYVQSDEISIAITDFDNPEAHNFFEFRLCKLQSILASLATAKFNQLVMYNSALMSEDNKASAEEISNQKLVQFDCKCWTVPTHNDCFAWFLYRQNDCVRNSRQQAAQTYLSHKKLMGLTTDKQIELLKQEKGIDWNNYSDGKKYGRIIRRIKVKNVNESGIEYERSHWVAEDAKPFTNEYFDQLDLIPNKDKRIKEVYVCTVEFFDNKEDFLIAFDSMEKVNMYKCSYFGNKVKIIKSTQLFTTPDAETVDFKGKTLKIN